MDKTINTVVTLATIGLGVFVMYQKHKKHKARMEELNRVTENLRKQREKWRADFRARHFNFQEPQFRSRSKKSRVEIKGDVIDGVFKVISTSGE